MYVCLYMYIHTYEYIYIYIYLCVYLHLQSTPNKGLQILCLGIKTTVLGLSMLLTVAHLPTGPSHVRPGSSNVAPVWV